MNFRSCLKFICYMIPESVCFHLQLLPLIQQTFPKTWVLFRKSVGMVKSSEVESTTLSHIITSTAHRNGFFRAREQTADSINLYGCGAPRVATTISSSVDSRLRRAPHSCQWLYSCQSRMVSRNMLDLSAYTNSGKLGFRLYSPIIYRLSFLVPPTFSGGPSWSL